MATLRIYSELGSADDVTARLGLAPSSSHRPGERRGARQGASRRTTGWSLCTEMREPSELAEHLIELLDRVEQLVNPLADLVADGYRMDWFCFVESRAMEHAVELDQQLLARLAALPGPLLIDIYGADEDQ